LQLTAVGIGHPRVELLLHIIKRKDMKNLTIGFAVPVLIAMAGQTVAAQESYEISRRMQCVEEGGELFLERRGERVSERIRKRIMKRLRHRIEEVESERRREKLEDRLDGVRFCTTDNGETGGGSGGGEGGSGGGESGSGGGSVGGSSTCPKGFAKQINVFGVRVCASSRVPDDKLLHTANILAEYLDNDEDGNADDPLVVETLLRNGAFLEMFKNENEAESSNISYNDGEMSQIHFSDETFPGQMSQGVFDITLEEVLHLVSSIGYHFAYPGQLGEDAGSRLTDAMDIARGGRFTSIPNPYPAGAWYTYDDQTCTYICQASEYFYWSLTSLLGAQGIPGRLEDIQHEWKPNTPEKLQSMDPAVYALLTDPSLKLPTRLPDGVYNGGELRMYRLR
jgi:hypothetical protein